MRILVIEDDPIVGQFVKRGLEEQQWTVDLEADGESGERAAGQGDAYDLIILDMRLPDTDGLSVLKQARALDPLLQVIVITAYGDVQSAVDVMKLGACDFLRKPYEMEDILLATESAGRHFQQANQLDLYRRRAYEAVAHMLSSQQG